MRTLPFGRSTVPPDLLKMLTVTVSVAVTLALKKNPAGSPCAVAADRCQDAVMWSPIAAPVKVSVVLAIAPSAGDGGSHPPRRVHIEDSAIARPGVPIA